MIGVSIKSGIMPWQILQQENGYAKVTVKGGYENENGVEDIPQVYIMVSREDTAEPVIWWKKCNMSKGAWSAELKIPVGGPYSVNTSMSPKEGDDWSEWGKRGDIIPHICVGDLYVIAGQSNSAGYGKDFVYDPSELGVHIYKNNKEWTLATHPLQDSTGALNNPNIDIGNTGHSLYLSFAKYLKCDLNYPIGLIQTSQGGSALSSWNPYETGVLYDNMLERIRECGGKIKGVIWYQGCTDTCEEKNAESYLERFSKMYDKLNEDINANVSWVVIQLSYCNDEKDGYDEDKRWGTVREQIRQMNRKLNDVYVVPNTDATFSDFIHVSALTNIRLGERAAKLLLYHVYGKNYMGDAPDIKDVKRVDKDTVIAEFDNVYERLSINCSPKDLAIKAEDKNGITNVLEYEIFDRCKIRLKFERDLENDCFLHGAYTKSQKDFVPFDYATHLPILSFYGVKVN